MFINVYLEAGNFQGKKIMTKNKKNPWLVINIFQRSEQHFFLFFFLLSTGSKNALQLIVTWVPKINPKINFTRKSSKV